MKKFLTPLLLSLTVLTANVAFASQSPTPQSTEQGTEQPTQVQSQKVNFSPLFIALSDVMTLAKNGDMDKAKSELDNIKSEFAKLPIDNQHNELKNTVNNKFDTALQNPSETSLGELSTALYALEKAQNPVDYTQANDRFAKKIAPAIEQLGKGIDEYKADKNLDKLRLAYDTFNRSWVANERVVRNTQKAHYGAIEMAMAMLRVAVETQNVANMDSEFAKLKGAIDSYIKGEPMSVPKVDESVNLAYGIKLLEQGLDSLQSGDKATADGKLSEFITSWVVFEGDVSTRNPALYSEIESQIPVIMAKGDKPSQDKLAKIINDLKAINPTASYTALDSMLILLREGLEALLIVVALITALNASGQTQGKKWIYGGVGLGLVGSLAGAVALYKLFPAMTGGANREALEGVVGIVAVVMMIGVGAWLHSKSSVKSWNNYIKNELGRAMSTGSFISLFLLAFLSVFREGAETILFYVGILPNIAMSDFLMGIAMALGVLVVVAVILFKTSVKLPIPLLFKILTVTIYFLGFKILGVSISALQLTNYLPRTMINLPSIEWAGFYPSVQGVVAQGIYLAVIVIIWLMGRKGGARFADS